MERDAACTQAEAARQDYRARLCASTSSSKHSINFYRMLQERQRLLSLQETDLEVREMKLAEEGSGPTSLRFTRAWPWPRTNVPLRLGSYQCWSLGSPMP
jgi:hypothetical protein